VAAPSFLDANPARRAETASTEHELARQPLPWTLAPLPAGLETGFGRVGVRVQIIGGETREIRCDGECHELALDLNGHPMATMLFWVQSEQDCFLRVANWDSNGASAVLVPNRLDGFMPFMVHAGEPPVRVPALSRNALCGSDSASPPDGDDSVSRPTSNNPNYAIGIQCGALYEVSCARLPCVCSRVRFGGATGSICAGLRTHLQPPVHWSIGPCQCSRRSSQSDL